MSSTLSTPVRILVVEDNPADAALVTRQVDKTLPGATCCVLDTADAVTQALRNEQWDAVLSDYALRSFDALRVLAIVRAIAPDLPVVVMSGTIGEERAVELLHAGASDFVIKGNAERIVSVLERTVAAARDHKMLVDTEDRLIEALREWQDTYDAISDGVLILDATGSVRRANRACVDDIGLRELRGLTMAEVLVQLKPDGDVDPDLVRPLHTERFEWGPCADGRWYEVTIDPVGLSRSSVAMGFVAILSNITMSKHAEDELCSLLARLRRTMQGSVAIAVRMVESRDPYTAGHQEGVADLAGRIAREMGLPADQTEQITTAALLHDIGKISVPAEILVRPGTLQDIEWAMIKRHPELGAEILGEAEFDGPVREIVWSHHERLDGSGYPRGLSGDQIPLEARIVSVADVAEAMMAHRPYRPANSMVEIRAELMRGRGSLYDEQVVDAALVVLASAS